MADTVGMLTAPPALLSEHPAARLVLQNYVPPMLPQPGDGWIARPVSIEGVEPDQLSPLHGKLIAFGLLDVDVDIRHAGVRYRLTTEGRDALTPRPAVTDEAEEPLQPVLSAASDQSAELDTPAAAIESEAETRNSSDTPAETSAETNAAGMIAATTSAEASHRSEAIDESSVAALNESQTAVAETASAQLSVPVLSAGEPASPVQDSIPSPQETGPVVSEAKLEKTASNPTKAARGRATARRFRLDRTHGDANSPVGSAAPHCDPVPSETTALGSSMETVRGSVD